MNGADKTTATMFRAVELIPLNEALLCVNCQVISRSKNDCVCCGSQSLLHLANVLERSNDSISSTMPTQSEAGPEPTNAIIYSFQPRCLPTRQEGIA